MSDPLRARSGRVVDDVTLDAVRAGDVTIDDLSIHPDTLAHQAEVARTHGNPQLAANFDRAAELTTIPDSEVLAIYEALRPRRSTGAELDAVVESLAHRGLTRTAALVAEARETYGRRGLLR